jgi:hypothetical protein
MAKDIAALVTAVDADPVYDAALISGNNNELRRLLHEPNEGLSARWRPIGVDDFLDAIAGDSFTAEQEERIRTYTQNADSIPVHKPGIRAWCMANLSVAAIANLRTLSEQTGRPVDTFCTDDDTEVSLQDIRDVVSQIPRAYVNQAAARAEARAPRVAAAAAQRESIRQTVTAGYPDSIRPEIIEQYSTQEEQIDAEVRLQDRAARAAQ